MSGKTRLCFCPAQCGAATRSPCHRSLLDTSHPDIIPQLRRPGTTTQALGDPPAPGTALSTGSDKEAGTQDSGHLAKVTGLTRGQPGCLLSAGRQGLQPPARPAWLLRQGRARRHARGRAGRVGGGLTWRWPSGSAASRASARKLLCSSSWASSSPATPSAWRASDALTRSLPCWTNSEISISHGTSQVTLLPKLSLVPFASVKTGRNRGGNPVLAPFIVQARVPPKGSIRSPEVCKGQGPTAWEGPTPPLGPKAQDARGFTQLLCGQLADPGRG